MDWILGYLLIGFVIHFAGTQWLRVPPHESWQIELSATLLWPLTILMAIFSKQKKRT